MRALVVGLCIALANSSPASASDLLASGPVPTDLTANVAVCYLINVGSSTVTLSSIAIYYDFQTTPIPTISNTCGGTLLPGKTCRTVSNISPSTFVCRAVVSDKTNIRGDFQIRSGSVTTSHQALR